MPNEEFSNTTLILTLGRIEEASSTHKKELGKLFKKTDEMAVSVAKIEVTVKDHDKKLELICPPTHIPRNGKSSLKPVQVNSTRREIKLPFLTIRGFTVAGLVVLVLVVACVVLVLSSRGIL